MTDHCRGSGRVRGTHRAGRRAGRAGVAVLALAAVAGACTEADVFETPGVSVRQDDNRLRVVGDFCTEHPDEMNYPVKILFVIDCSQSMSVTDPAPTPNDYPGRVEAVWKVIQKFRYDPGVSFGIIRFEGAANVATQVDSNGDGFADSFGFVNDLPSLLRALNSLQAAGGNTSYQAALGLAEATLAMDMGLTTIHERGRSRYIVIFLTDGLPYPQGNGANTPASITQALRELMNLEDRFGVRELSFHTSYLSVDTPEYVKAEAEGLLQDMADIGNGTYRNFNKGGEINFLYIDFTSVKRMYSIKNGAFLVSNANAHPAFDLAESIDTDGDGLVDLLEADLGTHVGTWDTDADGFGDLLEYRLRRSGFDPLDPTDADCRLALDRLDRDGDGLRDCEERFLGTSPDLFDTDADGVPDPLELRAGTNPVWSDTAKDMDFDGSLNGDEVAWHTNPAANDASQFSKLAYRYHFGREAGIFESRFCYHFQVDNITLVGTQPRSEGARSGFNDIMVYAGQIPLDEPDDHGTFRVACARVRYVPRYPEPDLKYPPSGLVRFAQQDFKRPVATQCRADEECPHHVCDPANQLCLAPLGERCDEATPCGNFRCEIDPNTGDGACEYPVRVACLEDADCPPYPADPVTGRCLDAAGSAPDPATGLCPRRACQPQYDSCSAREDCPDNHDADPDNDDDCVGGFCRSPCAGAYACNPGETCEPDGPGDLPACASGAECGAGQACDLSAGGGLGVCRPTCVTASDCPALTDSCENDVCVGHHCVDHHGGSCVGIPCGADADCPPQPCDAEVGRCRVQPCLDSRECPHQACELVVGVCTGPTCADDTDCRGVRGFTCNPMIGEPCDRDIDCPFDFCTLRRYECANTGQQCEQNEDCPGNGCSGIDPDSGQSICAQTGELCQVDLDCPPNFCRSYLACVNAPDTPCDLSLDCPQTFCGSNGRCVNNPDRNCNPATENANNNCRVEICNRAEGRGTCDTVDQEPCVRQSDCPSYRCNPGAGLCDYPVRVACTAPADCPEAGMVCTDGFCELPCSSDADCPPTRCQGRCVPPDPADQQRCTDWFDADRDCVVYGD